MTRPSKDDTWLNVAMELSRQSTCLRRAVGCVLLDARGHVTSTGWNGVASKQPHCNEVTGWAHGAIGDMDVYDYACPGARSSSGTNLDACQAIHAEQNALLQCANVYDLSTCYVTHSPCVACTKLLMSTSCNRIVFLDRYAHDEVARKLWESMDRAWVQHAP
jgi:dCMP deaminase